MGRFYQAVVDIIRGGVHPREVGLAVALGLLAGFLSGWNLCLAAVLLIVLVMNVPTKVFGEAWALGWAASWTLTPASFAIGRWLLAESPLGSALAPWREHPLLVLFDLDRYTLVGGGALALVAMLPAAWLAANVTRVLQIKFQEIQTALEARTAWQGPVLVRLGCWLIFGDASQPAPAPAVNPDWVRRRGLMLALCVFAPAGVLGCYFAPGGATNSLLTLLSTANQSEVNAGQMRLTFGDGLLEIEDLQVSDPDHPDRDRLRIGYVAAQLRPGPLLRGRVHVERVMMENIETDTARQHRARPYGVRLPEFDAVKDLLPEGNLIPEADAIDLAEYVSQWETHRERLRRLEEMLKRIDELSGQVPGQDDDEQGDYDPSQDAPAGYLAMRQARHSFGRPVPKVWIELAAFKGLAGQFGLGSEGSIELVNLSSQPSLTGQPTVVAVKAPQHGAEIVATLNLHHTDAHHDLKFHATGIDLAGLIQPASPRMPLAVQRGTINVVGRGWLTAEEFQMNVNAELADLNVQVLAQRPLAGLPPQLWNDGLAQLQQLQTEATLGGRWTSPQLRVDADRLVQQFQQQLLAAGQVMLARAIDEQVARGEALVDQSLARADAAIDRQAAKVQAAGDRYAARAGQAVDNAAAQVDGVVAQGQERVAGIEQRVEQSAAGVQNTLDNVQGRFDQAQQRVAQNAAQAQQTAQQWQNQFGAAGRFFQENVAAGALTSPGPGNGDAGAPSRPEQMAPQDAAADVRRRGPPPLQYGDVVGAAAVEQSAPPVAAPSNAVAAPVQPQQAPPPSDGMRYPDLVRNFAAQAPAVVTPAREFERVAQPQVPAPPVENNLGSRPASFEGPPALLELGYDARRPISAPPAERYADRRAAAGGAPFPQQAPVSGPVTGRNPAYAPPPGTSLPYTETVPETAKAETVGSRIGNWSRGVTSTVKGVLPWQGGGAATVSDDAIAPPDQTGPAASAETASAPQLDNPPADTPWYRRFWR